jgi:transposase
MFYMRGLDYQQGEMFCYLSLEAVVPANHPLRPIREMADRALRELSDSFAQLYSGLGRDSVPPEQLLRALILQVLYSVRSERMLVEQLRYNLLFRWFVGVNIEDRVWDATSFTKNRQRFLQGDIAQKFFAAVGQQAKEKDLLSDEHFTVDGTLLEAWASKKSYQKKDNPPEQGSGSRGEMLLRDTHESKTDPDAQMYRKNAGGEFKLCHMAHLLMENRHGLAVAGCITAPSPEAERNAAVTMLESITRKSRATLGGDKNYDEAKLVVNLREMNITPHVTQYEGRKSNIDGRTTRHPGYEISLNKRKCIEPIFGWLKNTALMRKVRHRGHERVEWMFTLALSAYNLVRMRNLSVQPA